MSSAAAHISRLRRMIATRLAWSDGREQPDARDFDAPPRPDHLVPADAPRLYADGLARWEANHGLAAVPPARFMNPVRVLCAACGKAACDPATCRGVSYERLDGKLGRGVRSGERTADSFAYAFAKATIMAHFAGVVPPWQDARSAIAHAAPTSAFEGEADDDSSRTAGGAHLDRISRLAMATDDDDDPFIAAASPDDADRWATYCAQADRELGLEHARLDADWQLAAFLETFRAQLDEGDQGLLDGYQRLSLAGVAALRGGSIWSAQRAEQRVIRRAQAAWIEQHGEPLPDLLHRRPRHDPQIARRAAMFGRTRDLRRQSEPVGLS